MASFCYSLSLFLFIISFHEIFAVPLKRASEEGEKLGLLEKRIVKRESETLRLGKEKSRDRREVPNGCTDGRQYGLAKVPHCHVEKAVYMAGVRLCLVKVVRVPGMPDGDKGYNYLAYKHFLYKAYNATFRYDIVKCPTAASIVNTTTQATPGNITSSSSPARNVATAPSVSLTTAKTVNSTRTANSTVSSATAKTTTKVSNTIGPSSVAISSKATGAPSRLPSTSKPASTIGNANV